MTPEQATALRAPFPQEVIGHLPRIWCKSCSEARRGGGTCGNHSKWRCSKCNNNITEAHIDLDYVGHAETTDRFLQVDPEWTWEPMSFGPNGLPQLDDNGALWIRLTIAGVTRIGYGSADGKRGPDAIKECIGDALRNAGMRFGVALDLWGAKFKGDDDPDGGEVHGHGEEPDRWESAQPARPAQPSRESIIDAGHKAIRGATTTEQLNELRAKVDKYALDNTITLDDAQSMHAAINGREVEMTGNATAAPVAGKPMTDQRKNKMFALFSEVGLDDRAKQVEFIQKVTRREIASRNDVTNDEAYNVIGALESQVRMGGGRKDRHLTAVNGAAAS